MWIWELDFLCNAHIFPPVIDWSASFSQGGGFSGYETLWWSPKCCYFLFYLPNRKCHHFPACNWLIPTALKGRGFLGMTNKVRKFKMWKRRKSINYRQENAGNSCLTSKTGSEVILNFNNVFSIPRNPHPEKNGRDQSTYSRKMLTLPVFQLSLLASLSTSHRHSLAKEVRICLLEMLGGYSEKQKLR